MYRVGIDLAPASRSQAPGTARLVAAQARALFKKSVPWVWIPTFESEKNPLWEECAHMERLLVPGKKLSLRASFKLGPAWKKAGCSMGFSTAYFVPLNSSIPVVANFFDSNIYEHGKTWIDSGRRVSFYINRFLSTLSIRRSLRLFVISQYCIDYLARAFPRQREKFIFIPMGVNAPLPKSDPVPHWAENLGPRFFMYVGVFSENKNQRRLIEAWQLLQEKHPDLPSLVLIGRCGEDYRQSKIEPALKKLPRPAEVILPGPAPDSDLAWCYHHALAHLQPSIAEGFGLPVIEAMSYGLPVACSNTTSLPETGGNAVLLFDPFSPESMAQAVEQLWQSESLREELKIKGAKRWTVFNWEANADVVATEIQKVLQTLPSQVD